MTIDSRVVKDALEKGFSAPPGRYYLADAGYAATGGILLTPFKKVRYHLKEWGIVEQKPKNKEELFNLRHASARNVVERTFGVFKARFAILSGRGREGFSISTQAKLIYALAAVHNFMNMHGANPGSVR
jgi:DDE superfamily endonuclease